MSLKFYAGYVLYKFRCRFAPQNSCCCCKEDCVQRGSNSSFPLHLLAIDILFKDVIPWNVFVHLYRLERAIVIFNLTSICHESQSEGTHSCTCVAQHCLFTKESQGSNFVLPTILHRALSNYVWAMDMLLMKPGCLFFCWLIFLFS